MDKAQQKVTHEKNLVWVIVPAYDEGPIIAETVKSILEMFPHIIVVDDGSADNTGNQALAAGAFVATHPINLGQGAALQTGIDFALNRGASHVVTFDADGQHQALDANLMLNELITGDYDVVLGSRFLGKPENMPFARRLVLKLAIVFTNLTCKLNVTDTHNGLRVLTARAAAKLDIKQNGMAHASEILEQLGRLKLRIKEVPVTVSYTEYSLQKGQKLTNSFRILSDILMGRIFK